MSNAWSAASREPSSAASATSCWTATSCRSVAANASGRSSVRSPMMPPLAGDRAHLDRAVGGQRGDEIVVRAGSPTRCAPGSPVIAARRIGRSGSLVSHCQNASRSHVARDDRVGDVVDHVAHASSGGRGSLSAPRARPPRGSTRPRGCRSSRSRHRTGRADSARTRTSRRRRSFSARNGVVQIGGDVGAGRRVARGDERGEMVEAGGPALDRPPEQAARSAAARARPRDTAR